MTRKRTYASHNDGCAAAHALDVVGERWALIVVRELLLGPKRFADLALDIPGITPSSLTSCLRSLQDSGVLVQRRLPVPGQVVVYELTAWGQQLETVTSALSRWGAQSPHLPRGRMSADTVILATRAHARDRADSETVTEVAIELTDPDHPDRPPARYLAWLGPQVRITKSRTPTDATIHTDSETWRQLLFRETTPDEAHSTGRLTGSTDHARTLLNRCHQGLQP